MFPLVMPYFDIITGDRSSFEPVHIECNLHENNLITVEAVFNNANCIMQKVDSTSCDHFCGFVFSGSKKIMVEVGIALALEHDVDIGYEPLCHDASWGHLYACFAPQGWEHEIKQQIYDTEHFFG